MAKLLSVIQAIQEEIAGYPSAAIDELEEFGYFKLDNAEGRRT